MNEKVVFHVLNQKFLERESDIPETAQQVMYYSLAIGHHVGVIDCFKQVMEMSVQDYTQWIEQLPKGEAQRKMAGLMKFGEIVIDVSHISILARAFMPLLKTQQEPFLHWSQGLLEILSDIGKEPAMYLMVKRQQAELT